MTGELERAIELDGRVEKYIPYRKLTSRQLLTLKFWIKYERLKISGNLDPSLNPQEILSLSTQEILDSLDDIMDMIIHNMAHINQPAFRRKWRKTKPTDFNLRLNEDREKFYAFMRDLEEYNLKLKFGRSEMGENQKDYQIPISDKSTELAKSESSASSDIMNTNEVKHVLIENGKHLGNMSPEEIQDFREFVELRKFLRGHREHWDVLPLIGDNVIPELSTSDEFKVKGASPKRITKFQKIKMLGQMSKKERKEYIRRELEHRKCETSS